MVNPILETQGLTISYGNRPAVKGVSLKIPPKKITAIIGPSGCGKSTLLRVFNRMNDFIDDVKVEGTVKYHDEEIYAKGVDPVSIRRKIGMVFQKPNPFPGSIFKNIAWGPRINGFQGDLNSWVQTCLKKAALWDEVKDKLTESGLALSGGQQQRLCIARTIAMDPEVILLDEPCSALDPASTARIEELLHELKEKYTIAIVTHNMQQAARLSDYTAFMCQGDLVEFGETKEIFTAPKKRETEDYVTGKFG